MDNKIPTLHIDTTVTPEEEEYLQTLTEKQRKGYFIARDHLGDLFQLTQQVGYLAFRKKKVSGTSLQN